MQTPDFLVGEKGREHEEEGWVEGVCVCLWMNGWMDVVL